MTQFSQLGRTFGVPVATLIFGIIAAYFFGGWAQAGAVTILAILEISLSFDNSVINASILKRLSPYWQQIFMTVGIVIAVVGMRILFPILIVVATSGLSVGSVIDLALHHPEEYAHSLDLAHPAIAAFGGTFLLLIFLDFLINETKTVHWIRRIEVPLAKAGRLPTLSVLLALLALLTVSATWAGEDAARVLTAGVVGIVTYLGVRGISQLFEAGVEKGGSKIMVLTGKAAFFMFLYLEVLDASFSLDGVIGAFAVTTNVITIAIGLGVGALFIRALTVWLVRHDTLDQFEYLEHGAHYAVGALATLLGLSLAYEVPEAVTGLLGAGFIVVSLITSVVGRKKDAPHDHSLLSH